MEGMIFVGVVILIFIVSGAMAMPPRQSRRRKHDAHAHHGDKHE